MLFMLRKAYAVAAIESGEGEFRVMGCRDIEGAQGSSSIRYVFEVFKHSKAEGVFGSEDIKKALYQSFFDERKA